MITERSGSLRIRVLGTGGGSSQAWREAVADAVYASGVHTHEGVAFTARQEEGSGALHLEANLSKGLLIIACITRSNGDGRPGSFLREFFYRSKAGDAVSPLLPRPSGTPAQGGSAALTDRRPDPRLYLGRWMNTDATAGGMVEVEFTSRDPGLTLHVRAAEGFLPGDWGEVEVELFVDPLGLTEGTCIAAGYDLGGTKVALHGWIKLGVLVLASFIRFDENGQRSNCFDRDFFYHVPPHG